MSFLESLIISAFGLGMVFVILIGLSAVVTVESKIFNSFKFGKKAVPAEISPIAAESQSSVDTGATAGELKLIGVDERTAAMIMAIVSDESKIPLSELQFKSIKAVD